MPGSSCSGGINTGCGAKPCTPQRLTPWLNGILQPGDCRISRDAPSGATKFASGSPLGSRHVTTKNRPRDVHVSPAILTLMWTRPRKAKAMLSALVDEADPPTKLFRSAATGRVAAVLVSADHLEFRDADRHAVRDAPWARGRHRIRACARSTAARNRHCSG